MAIIDNTIDWTELNPTPIFFKPFGEVTFPKAIKPCKKEKENNMASLTQNTASVTVTPAPVDEAKKYLELRLRDLHYDKTKELRNVFHIEGLWPSTAKEAKAWLKSGNYRLELPKYVQNFDDEDALVDNCGHVSAYFYWGKDEPDQKAYKAAKDKLEAAYQTAVDEISVVTDEDARLKALRDFEAYKVQ